jgi:two-component system OmpR family sensor kinase
VGTGINTPGLGFRTLVLHDGLGGVMGEDGRTITLSAAQRKILASVPTDSRPRDIELGDGLDHYRVVAILAPNNETWITGLPLDGVEATVRKLAIGVLLVTLLVLGATILIGSAVIRVTLRPLNRVTATALRVSELPLSSGNAGIAERVPDADTDPNTEVGQVGTALNRLLDHIAAALAARQASENRVRRFVSDASHELRTPLASIRGYAELARRTREPVPGDVAHALSRVQSEADRMTALVEDLLMLARLDERRAMEREEVDLTTTVIDAVSDAHAAGPGHNWQLELPDEPVLVRGDQHRLHQVIANLLANARAHTPPGTKVTTAVTWEAALNQAVLTVSDTGPGIPAELQGEVFDRFARGDSSRNRAGGASTGLGLAIVSSVVAAHGGTVAVTSRPGETVFTVRLPGMG